MTKNVQVVDEEGNDYGTTYPKRAKGLVKNGRARFAGENRICLACPPNIILEDCKMENIDMNKAEKSIQKPELTLGSIQFSNTTPAAIPVTGKTAAVPELTMEYILAQIEKIASQNEHTKEALKLLGNMADGDAKANAIANVIKNKEITNQKALDIYMKLIDNLQPKKYDFSLQKHALEMLGNIVANGADDNALQQMNEILDTIRHMSN